MCKPAYTPVRWEICVRMGALGPGHPATAIRVVFCAPTSMQSVKFGFTATVAPTVKRAPGQWAGATVLLTLGVLGLAMVAALCGRGTRRAACLGATAIGVGYILPVTGQPVAIMTDVNNWPWTQVSTNSLLNARPPWVPKLESEFPPTPTGSPSRMHASSERSTEPSR